MLTIEHLSVRYGAVQALDDVSFQVQPGEFVLLTGPSGCGKSTLARCLNGLIPHSLPARVSGRIVVDGKDTATHSVAQLATSVGLVFQNAATQLFNLKVGEEVAFGPRNLGLAEAEVGRRVSRALAAVNLTDMSERPITHLSGGEQQRLAIAAVLAMGPRLLVLDEPTASLDVRNAREVMATLDQLNKDDGVTVIVIEHRLGEVARLAGRTMIMDEGHLVADGPTDAVLSQPTLWQQFGLRRPADELQDDWASLLASNGHHAGPPVVELKNVCAGYGRTMILRDLSLTLYQGEFTALVGDNGAGKSTLARVLAGLIKPKSGQVLLRSGTHSSGNKGNGHKLSPGRDIGLLFQNPLHQLFCDTVTEELRLGPSSYDCFDAVREDAILAATDLLPLRHRPVHSLSAGQQQRAALAAVLTLAPRLIILDEPTMGQDWRHLSRFMDFLVALNEAGCTILLITHDYKLVHHYAQRIVLLADGHIFADRQPRRAAGSMAQVERMGQMEMANGGTGKEESHALQYS